MTTCTNDNTIKLWDAKKGTVLKELQNLHQGPIDHMLLGQQYQVLVTFSPDKTVLARKIDFTNYDQLAEKSDRLLCIHETKAQSQQMTCRQTQFG